jgi:hypothetical protein
MMREPILLDSAPVAAGSLYVCDGKPVVSTITGTVADLKTATGAAVIRAIDVPARRVQMWPDGSDVFMT